MRPQKAGPGVLRQLLRYLLDREAGGIGAHNSARLEAFLHLAQQIPLDLEVLDDALDDPVNIGKPLEMVLEIARRDKPGVIRDEHRRGSRRPRGLEPCRGQLAPESRGIQSQPLLRVLGVQLLRHDVQQVRGYIHARQKGRDLASHHAGAEHGRFSDLSCLHGSPRHLLHRTVAAAPWAARCVLRA